MKNWMIYGANGYTGERMAREAKKRGLTPVLAGRKTDEMERIGKELGLATRVFALDKPDEIVAGLQGMDAVLLCAGPFSKTSRPMLDACLKTGTHYLDITGEIGVFEAVQARDAEIRKAGIAAIPGVGFDVVPTDCLALLLKQKLPDATELDLALKTDGKPSPGTLKTGIEGLHEGGLVRRNGKLTRVAIASPSRQIAFDGKPVLCAALPWGDVSTAFHSTGIPDVTVYFALPRPVITGMKAMGLARPLFALSFVQAALKKLVTATVKGPTPEEQARSRALLWGEARNAHGKKAELCLSVPDGYLLTVDAGLKSLTRVLKQGDLKGALTPSKAFGADFVFELDGVKSL